MTTVNKTVITISPDRRPWGLFTAAALGQRRPVRPLFSPGRQRGPLETRCQRTRVANSVDLTKAAAVPQKYVVIGGSSSSSTTPEKTKTWQGVKVLLHLQLTQVLTASITLPTSPSI